MIVIESVVNLDLLLNLLKLWGQYRRVDKKYKTPCLSIATVNSAEIN